MNEQVWWFVARASGIVAWFLAALSVLWGLALATRALGRRPGAPWLLDLHRFLGGLTVTFVLVHLVGLWADSYVDFGPVELLVPFTSTWKPGPVAWGIVAFYLLVAVEVTSLLMKRLPKRLWHGVHLTSYALYAFATVHLLLAGSDAENSALRWSVLVSIGAVVFFSVYRAIGPGKRGSVAPASTSGTARTPAGRSRAGVAPTADATVPTSDGLVSRDSTAANR